MRQMNRDRWRKTCPGVPACAKLLSMLLMLTAGGSLQGRGQAAATAGPPLDAGPVVVTLEQAIKRAEANEPEFAAARADSQVAGLDRWIARAGLLPNAVYHNQALYSQTDRGQTIPRFIANNAAREYSSQGVFNETLGLGQLAGVRRADAEEARAKAELEVARRGLVAAVTGLYYGVVAEDNKLTIAERAYGEATAFTELTSKREQERESAHADTVKAQLLEQQRERDLSDARVAAEKARLELGVLLFADPRTPYTVTAADGSAPLSAAPRR